MAQGTAAATLLRNNSNICTLGRQPRLAWQPNRHPPSNGLLVRADISRTNSPLGFEQLGLRPPLSLAQFPSILMSKSKTSSHRYIKAGWYLVPTAKVNEERTIPAEFASPRATKRRQECQGIKHCGKRALQKVQQRQKKEKKCYFSSGLRSEKRPPVPPAPIPVDARYITHLFLNGARLSVETRPLLEAENTHIRR